MKNCPLCGSSDIREHLGKMTCFSCSKTFDDEIDVTIKAEGDKQRKISQDQTWKAGQGVPVQTSQGDGLITIEPRENNYSYIWKIFSKLTAYLAIIVMCYGIYCYIEGNEDDGKMMLQFGIGIIVSISVPLRFLAYIMDMAQRALRYLSIIAKNLEEKK